MSEKPQADGLDYRLSITSQGDTLIVRVTGSVDAQSVRIAYCTEVLAEARARGCRKILGLDRKKGKPASPAELAELAQIFAADGAYFHRIAVVEQTAEFVAALEHGEILARAAGLNLRIFADEKNAEHWLHYGAPGE